MPDRAPPDLILHIITIIDDIMYATGGATMHHDTAGGAPRRRLSDILNGGADSLRDQWRTTEAAADYAPLPAGEYVAHVQSVELFNARTGTPGVKIAFRVIEGEHVGRGVWHDCWLTPAALPQTKRDCTKLGLDSIDKLEGASVEPGRIRCAVRVALRTTDDGATFNVVRRFDVLGIDEPPSVDDTDFAPPAAPPAVADGPPPLIDTAPEPDRGRAGYPYD